MPDEKFFSVTIETVVKAPNMTNARELALKKNGAVKGEIVGENIFVEELQDGDIESVYLDYTVEDDDLSSIYLEPNVVSDNVVNFLRSENRRLVKLLDKYKTSKIETINAVYHAAKETFGDFNKEDIGIDQSPHFQPNNNEQVAVIGWADWQMGKVTKSYNSSVCAKRIDLYVDKVLRKIDEQRYSTEVNHLRIWALGDIVEGEEIFPSQSHVIDGGVYRQVGVVGPEVICSAIEKLLQNVETIHFVGVIGNHGSIGGTTRKQHDPETNMDRLLYRIIQLIYKDNPRVTFNIPDGRGERNFYAVDSIGNYSALLIHGDQFPPPNSNYAYFKKIMGWKDGSIEEPFDDVFMGHYHHNVRMTLGSSALRVLPSPESHNTFAQEVLGSSSVPSQAFYFVDPIVGRIASEHNIWLDEI